MMGGKSKAEWRRMFARQDSEWLRSVVPALTADYREGRQGIRAAILAGMIRAYLKRLDARVGRSNPQGARR